MNLDKACVLIAFPTGDNQYQIDLIKPKEIGDHCNLLTGVYHLLQNSDFRHRATQLGEEIRVKELTHD